MTRPPSLSTLVEGVRDARFEEGGRRPGHLDCAGAALLVLGRLGLRLPADALPAAGEPGEAAARALAKAGALEGPGWRIHPVEPGLPFKLGDLLLSDAEGPHLAVIVQEGAMPLAVTVTRRQGGLMLRAERVPAVRGRYRVKLLESCPEPVRNLQELSGSCPQPGFLFATGAREDPA